MKTTEHKTEGQLQLDAVVCDPDTQVIIPVALGLSEPQLYALLNCLIDTVCGHEAHPLLTVLDAVGDAVSAYELASGIDEALERGLVGLGDDVADTSGNLP